MDARQDCVTQPAKLLPVAAQAMDIAGRIIRDRLPAVVSAKGDRDMVSDIDVEIEHAVRGYLHERNPEIGFVGEEEGSTTPDALGLQWLLDPIDGTANFVKGIPLYSISLALVIDNRPILGIIDVPADGSRYSAAEGYGAFYGDTPIHVRPTEELRTATITVGDYAVGERAETKNELRLAVNGRLAQRALRVRMLGSAAIDLAWLAHGRTDAAIIFGGKAWDVAAGVILVREARGIVIDATGAKHTLRSVSTIAASPQLAGQVLDVLPRSEFGEHS
jgi:myo-inositol-1(or 4)-monophosphatase